MDSVLDKPIVLKLNRLWQRIGFCTAREAFTAMCGGEFGGTLPAKGLFIETDDNGNLTEGYTLDWEDWVKLPIRDCDFSISTGKGKVRVPSVIVSPEYSGMHTKRQRLSLKALRERDGGICQVSKRKLAEGEGNSGHIIARKHGGTRTWENLIYMDSRLNSLQGTKTPEEMGWVVETPKAPLAVPVAFKITEPRHPHHQPFIN